MHVRKQMSHTGNVMYDVQYLSFIMHQNCRSVSMELGCIINNENVFRHTFTSHASVLSVHVHVHVSSVLTILWIDLSPAGDVAARVAVEIGVSLGQADGFDGITERQRVV